METSFKRAFAKDLRKIPQPRREKIEEFIFELAPSVAHSIIGFYDEGKE